MQNLLQNIIAKGQEKGEVPHDLTSEQLIEQLFIVARGIVFDWCLHDGEYELEDFMVIFWAPRPHLFSQVNLNYPLKLHI